MGGAKRETALEDLLSRLQQGRADGPSWRASAERLIRADPVTEAFVSLGLDLAAVAGERMDMFLRCAALCPVVSLNVAGHGVQARMSPAELWRFYLPVCQAVLARVQGAEGRVLVGVAGPGASGKSVFAGLLVALLRTAASGEGPRAALCAMDGFHRPNSYLDNHFGCETGGRRVPLRALKGAPETFDAEAFVRCLRDLRAGRDLTVPRYDRRLHDPVADGPQVGPVVRVVLVEGNYLLLDRDAWAEVAGLLDLRFYVTLSAAAMRAAMVERHVRGGRSPEDAVRHFERVDEPNGRLIRSTVRRADLVIRRDADQCIASIERPPDAVPGAEPIESDPAS